MTNFFPEYVMTMLPGVAPYPGYAKLLRQGVRTIEGEVVKLPPEIELDFVDPTKVEGLSYRFNMGFMK